MQVDPAAGKPGETWQSRKFHFCSENCHEKFKADPYVFASGNNLRQSDIATQDADYTCPMHPEFAQKGPGSCPICGMALEPITATGEEKTRNWKISPAACGSARPWPFRW